MPGNIAQLTNKSSNSVCSPRDAHFPRLEAKLKRELGETVLQALYSDETEDIILNPNSSLWVKRLGAGFQGIGDISPIP